VAKNEEQSMNKKLAYAVEMVERVAGAVCELCGRCES